MDKRNRLGICLSVLAMAALILDTKTALQAGSQGVKLCLQTLVPSLFPFFLISNLLTSAFTGVKLPFVEKLLKLPEGSGSLFLIGLLGGYPVGAKSIAQAHLQEGLSDDDARRMLAFCNNAGPAFLFGIGARLLPNISLCWLLWAVHILSAVIVGLLTPAEAGQAAQIPKAAPMPVTQAIRNSVETMALVCGWVLIFRVLLGFAERWFLWLLPEAAAILLCGILELANGCCRLPELSSTGMRFLLCAVFLGFGGLCVALQTKSVAGTVDTGLYFPGKICQAAVSFLLCIPCLWLLPGSERPKIPAVLIALCLFICLIYSFYGRKIKKGVEIPKWMVYNQRKITR